MSTSTQIKPTNHPPAKHYSDVDQHNGYDPDMGEDVSGANFGEDRYVSGRGEDGDGAPVTADDLHKQITDLRAQINQDKNIKPETKTKLLKDIQDLEKQIDGISALSPKARPEKYQELQSKLDAIGENPSTDPTDPDNPDQPEDSGLRKELENLLQKVKDDDKIGDKDKTDLEDQVSKLIAKYDVNHSEVSQENIQEEMDKIGERINDLKSISAGAKNLEGTFGTKTAEEIHKLAEAKGIDLDKLPKPPTKDIFEFLAENIPSLKAALQKAKDAVLAKKKSDDDTVAAAKQQNSANQANTSNTVSYDTSKFQYLFDAQKHNDPASKAMAEAYSACTGELVKALQKIYPDVSITTVGTDFDNADLINFDNAKLDVLSNTEGTFIASESLTEDKELPLPEMTTLEYDWDGDGDWEDDHKAELEALQNEGYPTHSYDGGGLLGSI